MPFHTANELKEQNYYERLGVDRTASKSDIKKAYHKLALQYHPDKQPDADQDIIKYISEADETLSDEDNRRQYDLTLPFLQRRSPRATQSSQTGPSQSSFQTEGTITTNAINLPKTVKDIRDEPHSSTAYEAFNAAFETLKQYQGNCLDLHCESKILFFLTSTYYGIKLLSNTPELLAKITASGLINIDDRSGKFPLWNLFFGTYTSQDGINLFLNHPELCDLISQETLNGRISGCSILLQLTPKNQGRYLFRNSPALREKITREGLNTNHVLTTDLDGMSSRRKISVSSAVVLLRFQGGRIILEEDEKLRNKITSDGLSYYTSSEEGLSDFFSFTATSTGKALLEKDNLREKFIVQFSTLNHQHLLNQLLNYISDNTFCLGHKALPKGISLQENQIKWSCGTPYVTDLFVDDVCEKMVLRGEGLKITPEACSEAGMEADNVNDLFKGVTVSQNSKWTKLTADKHQHDLINVIADLGYKKNRGRANVIYMLIKEWLDFESLLQASFSNPHSQLKTIYFLFLMDPNQNLLKKFLTDTHISLRLESKNFLLKYEFITLEQAQERENTRKIGIIRHAATQYLKWMEENTNIEDKSGAWTISAVSTSFFHNNQGYIRVKNLLNTLDSTLSYAEKIRETQLAVRESSNREHSFNEFLYVDFTKENPSNFSHERPADIRKALNEILPNILDVNISCEEIRCHN